MLGKSQEGHAHWRRRLRGQELGGANRGLSPAGSAGRGGGRVGSGLARRRPGGPSDHHGVGGAFALEVGPRWREVGEVGEVDFEWANVCLERRLLTTFRKSAHLFVNTN